MKAFFVAMIISTNSFCAANLARVPVKTINYYANGDFSEFTCERLPEGVDPGCILKIHEKNRTKSFLVNFIKYKYDVYGIKYNYNIFGTIDNKFLLFYLEVGCKNEDFVKINEKLNPTCSLEYHLDGGKLVPRFVSISANFNGETLEASRALPYEQ